MGRNCGRGGGGGEGSRKKTMYSRVFLALFCLGALPALLPVIEKVWPSIATLGDAAALQEALFDGRPALVFCLPRDGSASSLDPRAVEAKDELGGVAAVYAVDCGMRLPSGKTVHQRFNVPTVGALNAIFAANGAAPFAVSSKYMSTGAALARFVREKSAPVAPQTITAHTQFEKQCLKKRACLVVAANATATSLEDPLARIVAKYRTLRVAFVDGRKTAFSLERSWESDPSGEPHLVMLRRTSAAANATVYAKLHKGSFIDFDDFVRTALGTDDDALEAGGFKELARMPAVRPRRKPKPATPPPPPPPPPSASKEEQQPAAGGADAGASPDLEAERRAAERVQQQFEDQLFEEDDSWAEDLGNDDDDEEEEVDAEAHDEL